MTVPFEEDAMPKEHRYTWFGPETVQQLKAHLNAAGEGAILKVQGQREKMTLEVLDTDPANAEAKVSVGGPLNEAHICPPICP